MARDTRWCRTNFSPSTVSPSRVRRWPVRSGSSAGMRVSSRAETTKLPALTASAPYSPPQAENTPPRTGPSAAWRLKAVPIHALAGIRSFSSTRRGTTVR